MNDNHKAVLHYGKDGQAIIVSVDNMLELRRRLHVSFAYTEVLGAMTYDHYDCWAVRARIASVVR